MVQIYMDEIKKWKPWWRMEQFSPKPLVIEINEEITKESFKINPNLIKNSALINVSNASPMLYSDILKMNYIYLIMAYVYQIDLIDFLDKSNEKLEENL